MTPLAAELGPTLAGLSTLLAATRLPRRHGDDLDGCSGRKIEGTACLLSFEDMMRSLNTQKPTVNADMKKLQDFRNDFGQDG